MRKWLRFPLQPPNEKGLRSSQALKFGAPGRIRTHDPLVRSQVLYPTELRAREALQYIKALRAVHPLPLSPRTGASRGAAPGRAAAWRRPPTPQAPRAESPARAATTAGARSRAAAP